MVSDALPELPAAKYRHHKFGTGEGVDVYDTDQMHAHYRKGWSDALANWPSNQRQRIETLELERKTLLEQLAQDADDRAVLEAVYVNLFGPVHEAFLRDPNNLDEYFYIDTDMAWRVWQACAARNKEKK